MRRGHGTDSPPRKMIRARQLLAEAAATDSKRECVFRPVPVDLSGFDRVSALLDERLAAVRRQRSARGRRQ